MISQYAPPGSLDQVQKCMGHWNEDQMTPKAALALQSASLVVATTLSIRLPRPRYLGQLNELISVAAQPSNAGRHGFY